MRAGADATGHRLTDSFINLSVTVVVEAVTNFRAGSSWDTLLGLAVHTSRHGPRTGPDPAGKRPEPLINLSVTVVINPIADFCRARMDGGIGIVAIALRRSEPVAVFVLRWWRWSAERRTEPCQAA